MPTALNTRSGQFGPVRNGGPETIGLAIATRFACALFPIGGEVYNVTVQSLSSNSSRSQKPACVHTSGERCTDFRPVESRSFDTIFQRAAVRRARFPSPGFS